MDGTALVMTGTAGGVVGVATDPPELPEAAISGFCVNINPRPTSVITALDPATAAHTLSFAVILRFICASTREYLIGTSDLRRARIPSLGWESSVISLGSAVWSLQAMGLRDGVASFIVACVP